jgi:hypothetical protein
MRRGPYAKVAARNVQLLERIRAIKAEHPFWGYRRVPLWPTETSSALTCPPPSTARRMA